MNHGFFEVFGGAIEQHEGGEKKEHFIHGPYYVIDCNE